MHSSPLKPSSCTEGYQCIPCCKGDGKNPQNDSDLEKRNMKLRIYFISLSERKYFIVVYL